MRAVLQRVRWAEVEADGQVLGHIEQGLVVYLGIALDDRTEDADWLADKIAALRIFEDADGKLNRSVQDVGGAVLAVPNFTLMADARKGRRPAFVDAARPEQAQALYEIAARYHRAQEPLAAAFYAERLRERFADSPWSGKAGQFLASPVLAGPPPQFAGPKWSNHDPEPPADEADRQEPTQ